MDLEEVALDAPLMGLGKNVLVETEAGRTILRRKGHVGPMKLRAHLPDGREVKLDGVPPERTLRQVVASMSAARPLRAFQLPDGQVEPVHLPLRTIAAYVPWVIGAALGAAGAFVSQLGLLRFVLLALGITILIVAKDASDKSRSYRQWALTTGGEKTKAIDYELPSLAEDIEIDDIKEEYGRLLSDIVYRIEHPALFDPQEPTSKEFTLALLQWDNNDGVVRDDERRELALRVRATFAAARANAERIGMAHLPESVQSRAGTALKAARLAVDKGATEAEREAALRSAVEILDELALYYLPSGTDARKAITGHAPLQLPGRRST